MLPSTSIHGTDNHGFAAGATPDVAFGLFGAMLDAFAATQVSEAGLIALAEAMTREDAGELIMVNEPADENPTVPPGQACFGQFMDRDLTFDPTPLDAGFVDRHARVDFRFPALDRTRPRGPPSRDDPQGGR